MTTDDPNAPNAPNQGADAPTPETRPLPVLRAMIDAVDREILQLLARRNGVVAEIAQYKRAHRTPIRDFTREREIIADRRNRGTRLGLQADLLESIFRLVLWGSRDRQAALKAELPVDMEPRAVAVIGGAGAMGRCIADLFAELGHPVMIADLDTPLTPREAAAVADVVIISVPIDETVGVINELGPLVRDDALLMDVTSIKRAPLEAMLAATRASVVGTHPIFGPSVHSLQGQRIVLTRGRGDDWFDWLDEMLRARGLSVMEATAQDHDRAMAIVQVLTHFSTEVMGKTLADLAVPIDKTLTFTSPVYLMELLMTARHFAQSPDLYASIQMSNPEAPAVTRAFVEAARRHHDTIAAGRKDEIKEMFDEVRRCFGPFTDQALEQSSFLIDRLVERT